MYIGNPLVIALQGTRYSDCSNFADCLENIMRNKNINTLRINVESYYKTINNDLEPDKSYDFYNPAAIDWDLMRITLDDIATRNETIQMCKFDCSNNTSYPFVLKNSFPDVVIIDGIFAINLFDDLIFNVSEYDCRKPSNQKINVSYILNPNNYSRI